MSKSRKCPACGGMIRITDPVPGVTLRCPHCGTVLSIARPRADRSADEPVAPPPAPDGDAVKTPPTTAPPPAPPVPSAASAPGDEPDLPTLAGPSSRRGRHRGRRVRWISLAVFLVVVVGGFAVTASLVLMLAGPTARPPRLQLREIPDGQITAGARLVRRAALIAGAGSRDEVRFEMVKGPAGARLDEQTGNLTWTPEPRDDLGQHQFVLRAVSLTDPAIAAEQSFSVTVTARIGKPEVEPIDDRQLAPGQTLQLTVKARDPNEPPAELEYALIKGPREAIIDPQSGQLRWTAGSETRDRTVTFTVAVRQQGENGLAAQTRFRVAVEAPERPADRLLAALEAHEVSARAVDETFAQPFSGQPVMVRANGEQIRVIEYPSPDAASAEARKLARSPDQYAMENLPDSWAGPMQYYLFDDVLVIYAGLNPTLQEQLGQALGSPLEVAATGSATFEPDDAAPPPPQETGPFTEEEQASLRELYENKQLFKTRSYPLLRAIFADRFQREQQEVIDAMLGGDMIRWLDEHQDVKEELYTAIDPDTDDVAECLRLFREIKEAHPDQLARYANLALAIAVTWDQPKVADRHRGPLSQAQAEAPDGLMNALENFAYYSECGAVENRVRFLPWEFLTLMVNHRTPEAERQWALQRYLPRRVNYGACYQHVPYDHGMLDSADRRGRISGKTYTLPNLRQFGGVCAHQADYAARVGQSIGVPAAYVNGKSVYGSNHAWVMWVELKSVTAQGIGFSLESFGRYRGDQYYVGHLVDPHTAERITDRQLELRLHTVGIGPLAKRQADMVMRVLPWLRDEQSLDVVQRFLFLRETIRLCPGNEQAWTVLAQMSAEPEVRRKHRQDMLDVMDVLFTTFARFPDFTLTVFDDLIGFTESAEQRVHLYERLIGTYEGQGRPDLACTARLELADLLVAQSEPAAAAEQLAAGIKRFPGEGRYVPKMLDRLEAICDEAEIAQEQLVPFYHSFLPLIKQKRGSKPSKYCLAMYERGIERFRRAGQLQLVQLYTAQLQQLQAAGGN